MKRILMLGMLAILSTCATAQAVPISVDLMPASLTVQVGQMRDVDILVSGLERPPAVGAFDLAVSFDSTILAGIGVTFGPFLGTPGIDALVDFSVSAGTIDLAAVSLLSPIELNALQPGAFRLATLSFMAVASGTTTLSLSRMTVDDAFGEKLEIVPEPGTLVLLGSGLLAGTRTLRRWLHMRRRGSA